MENLTLFSELLETENQIIIKIFKRYIEINSNEMNDSF
jgi:hypothetical protein